MIKLISKDSIEDGILQLGHKKLKLEQDMTAAEQGERASTHANINISFHLCTSANEYIKEMKSHFSKVNIRIIKIIFAFLPDNIVHTEHNTFFSKVFFFCLFKSFLRKQTK